MFSGSTEDLAGGQGGEARVDCEGKVTDIEFDGYGSCDH